MLESTEHSSSLFMPHGYCYLWQPGLVGLHLISDALIAIAYYSIPITLLHISRKRRDLPFDWMFQLFGAFIIACGTVHLLEVWTLWHPVYWLSGTLKAMTAGVSLYTAVALTKVVPQALALSNPARLEAANRELEQEIADRKAVEEVLRQSEARYRAVVEDQTELICCFSPDSTFNFVNEAYCRYFGRTREELLGKSWTPIILEEDLRLVKQQLATLNFANPVVTITNRVIRPDGVIRFQHWINRAIYDSQGTLQEVQAVGRDITDLKEIEAALQKSQRFIQKIADTAPVLLYVFDLLEKHNVYTNHKYPEMLGYTSEEIQAMGARWVNLLLHPEDLSLILERQQRWQAAKDGDVFQIEYRLKHRDGEWRYFQCQETLFARTAEGLPQQILGVAVDITDRKQTQQIQAALKEKEVLLKEIHHRVKNNLQIIFSLIRLQRRQVKDPEASDILLDSQNRIKSIALIHEKLYRSEDLSQIHLTQYIPNLVASLFSSYQIDSENICLNTQIDDIALDIDTAIPCGLIINELISNSLKYAFPGGRVGMIQVKMKALPSNKVQLVIRDDGVGIPVNFELEQSDSLGLKLVKDLTEQIEGTVEVNGTQGTEFKVTFSGSSQ